MMPFLNINQVSLASAYDNYNFLHVIAIEGVTLCMSIVFMLCV